MGHILNKTGVQTRRQRDKSVELKDEFQRISRSAAAMIRHRRVTGQPDEEGDSDDEDGRYERDADNNSTAARNYDFRSSALELSRACVHVGCEKTKRKSAWGPRQRGFTCQSFKVVAACCLIKEFDLAVRKEEKEAGIVPLGGGFLGVRSGRR